MKNIKKIIGTYGNIIVGISNDNKFVVYANLGGFIVSAERPPYSKWTINNVWAESYRICRGNGEFERTDSETDWDDLEDYIHSSEGIVSTITTDPNDPNSFYAKTLFATEQDDEINKGGE